MVQIDDILESKKWAAEKSDIDEGCLVLNADLVGVLWLAIHPFGNPIIWLLMFWFGMCLHSI